MSRGHSLVKISIIEAANASTIVSYRPIYRSGKCSIRFTEAFTASLFEFTAKKNLKTVKTLLFKSKGNYTSISNAVQSVSHVKGHSAGPFRTHTETVPKSPAACCGHDFCCMREKGGTSF